jgi:hypothetical protein
MQSLFAKVAHLGPIEKHGEWRPPICLDKDLVKMLELFATNIDIDYYGQTKKGPSYGSASLPVTT